MGSLWVQGPLVNNSFRNIYIASVLWGPEGHSISYAATCFLVPAMSASTPCHHSTGLDESHFKSLSDQAVDIDHLRKMLVGEMKDFLERCKKETCTYINDSYLQGMKRYA